MKEQVKATKKDVVFSNWIKIIIFILVITSLYFQLRKVDWDKTTGLEIHHYWAFLLALLLLVVNLGCEFLKWKVIVKPLQVEDQLVKNAFWAGIASGFMSPNGWGNFLGRLIFFQKRERMYIFFSTALANFSQLMPTLIFGIFALLYRFSIQDSSWQLTGIVALLLLGFYFFYDILIPKRRSKIRFFRKIQSIRGKYQFLKWPLLGYSVLRNIVFSLQYVLLFVAFGYTDFYFLLFGVWLIYLMTSFVPSLWSGKVLIRESAALAVFQGTVVSVPDILVVSILIYMINIALPAFLSSFIWLPKRKMK